MKVSVLCLALIGFAAAYPAGPAWKRQGSSSVKPTTTATGRLSPPVWHWLYRLVAVGQMSLTAYLSFII
jgi:hypothetical protein